MLYRAGGFTSMAHIDGLKLYRDGIQVALSDYNIPLMDGDSIMVPGAIGVVHVIGQVNVPGIIQYKPSKSLKPSPFFLYKASAMNCVFSKILAKILINWISDSLFILLIMII